MKDIMNTKEAAEYLHHGESTLELWRSQNKGPKFYKPGKKVLYFKIDLDDWVKNNG